MSNSSVNVQTVNSYYAFIEKNIDRISSGLPPVTEEEAHAALFRTINIGTKEFLYDLNTSNYKTNEEMLKSGKGILELQDLWTGKPCFLVASGPSLRKNIHHLKKIQGIFPIFCVDAAYPILMRAGIEPDLVFMIDTKDTQAKFFDIPPTKAKLCAVSCSHMDSIKAWKGDIYFFNTFGSDEDHEIQLKYGQDFGSIGVGGNVSTALLWFAVTFSGSNKIIFVGHDFSYPNIEMYYPEGGVRALIPRTKTTMMTWDIYGETVQTDFSLKSYKIWTEDTLKELIHDLRMVDYDIVFINCTEGGTFGTTSSPGVLKDFLKYATLESTINEVLWSAGNRDNRETDTLEQCVNS